MSYEAMKRHLIESGTTPENAERLARRNFPELVQLAEKDDRILEAAEQRECYRLLRCFRFRVWNLSQARASKQSEGLGDAFVTHEWLPLAFWWETKRQRGGKHSKEQIEFAEHCRRTETRYGTGDRYALAEYLVQLGVALRAGDRWDTLEPSAWMRAAKPTDAT